MSIPPMRPDEKRWGNSCSIGSPHWFSFVLYREVFPERARPQNEKRVGGKPHPEISTRYNLHDQALGSKLLIFICLPP